MCSLIGPVQFLQIIPISDTSVTIAWHAPESTLGLSYYRGVVSQWEDGQVVGSTEVAPEAPLVWTVSNLSTFSKYMHKDIIVFCLLLLQGQVFLILSILLGSMII